MTFSGVFFVNFEDIIQLFSIVEFEQVNICWEILLNTLYTLYAFQEKNTVKVRHQNLNKCNINSLHFIENTLWRRCFPVSLLDVLERLCEATVKGYSCRLVGLSFEVIEL